MAPCPPGVFWQDPIARPLILTIVVDAIDETDAHLGVIIGHEDDVKDVFTIRVQLP